MTKINPRDLKPGQRVRVSFEAEVHQNDQSVIPLHLRLKSSGLNWFAVEDFASIDLISDPIKVGDRVRKPVVGIGTVLAISGNAARVESAGYSEPMTLLLSDLTKVEASA